MDVNTPDCSESNNYESYNQFSRDLKKYIVCDLDVICTDGKTRASKQLLMRHKYFRKLFEWNQFDGVIKTNYTVEIVDIMLDYAQFLIEPECLTEPIETNAIELNRQIELLHLLYCIYDQYGIDCETILRKLHQFSADISCSVALFSLNDSHHESILGIVDSAIEDLRVAMPQKLSETYINSIYLMSDEHVGKFYKKILRK